MFWKRKGKGTSPDRLVTIRDDLSVQLKVKSPEEAKLAIKYLKLEKKDLALAKRQVAAQLRELKLAHRQENVSRAPATRGGGGLGKVVRAMQASEKYAARNRQLTEIMPLEGRKANIETLVGNIDRAILTLERYIQSQT